MSAVQEPVLRCGGCGTEDFGADDHAGRGAGHDTVTRQRFEEFLSLPAQRKGVADMLRECGHPVPEFLTPRPDPRIGMLARAAAAALEVALEDGESAAAALGSERQAELITNAASQTIDGQPAFRVGFGRDEYVIEFSVRKVA